MPPKVKVTREEIIAAALELLRQKGMEAVNARAVASVLGCSTQPIFSNYSSMAALQQETRDAAAAEYTVEDVQLSQTAGGICRIQHGYTEESDEEAYCGNEESNLHTQLLAELSADESAQAEAADGNREGHG